MREELDGLKVTAYALGELDDAERAALAEKIQASESAQRDVAEIQAAAAALRDAYRTALPHQELRPEQRAAIEAAASAPLRPSRPRSWLRTAAAATLAAAAVVAVMTVLAMPSLRRARYAPVRPGVGTPAEPSVSNVRPVTTTQAKPPASGVTAVATPAAPPMSILKPAPTSQSSEGDRLALGKLERQIKELQARADMELHGYVGSEVHALEERVMVVGAAPGVEGGVPGGVVGGVVGGAPGLKNEAGELYDAEPSRRSTAAFNTEAYDHVADNPFVAVTQDPRSTFSVDVDTASYSIVRRFLNGGERPPAGAVRIEELINYFPYAYEPPEDGRPFAVDMDVAGCPWTPAHRLVRIGLKGRELPHGERPPSNLVFLLDVSGSMNAPNKLPLVKSAMRMLVGELGPSDRVAIVVYAGGEGLALPSTAASDKAAILSAIQSLSPGGSTHGSAGIRLAYETAAGSFIEGGVNRVVLATDGDFNVGVTNQGDLVRLIEQKAKAGVFLTVLGFGMGNLKDSTLEKLADHGNGNYAYIDSLAEARKVLVEQAGGTLVTIAKDVKLQVEFNPRRVMAFRLIGYENRVLAHQDFNDDTKDAGEIGAGHTVTALYEVVPPGANTPVPGVDALKYQPAPRASGPDNGEILTVKLRYKEPDGQRSALIEVPLTDGGGSFQAASPDLRFAAAVAAFGMVLRESPHKGNADLARVRGWASGSIGEDPNGLRAEFLQLVDRARSIPAR